MKELEHREKRVNSVQVQGDKLLKEGHPAKMTVEVRKKYIYITRNSAKIN